jgi:hypothetical protein
MKNRNPAISNIYALIVVTFAEDWQPQVAPMQRLAHFAPASGAR